MRDVDRRIFDLDYVTPVFAHDAFHERKLYCRSLMITERFAEFDFNGISQACGLKVARVSQTSSRRLMVPTISASR